MGAETGWFRTESGVVLEMDLPLPDGIAGRVKKGEIVRVANAAGDPWQEPATVLPEVTAGDLAEALDKAGSALNGAIAALEQAVKERDAALAELEQVKAAASAARPVKATRAAAAKAD